MNDAYIQEDSDYRQQEEAAEYEYWLFEQEFLLEQANKKLNEIKNEGHHDNR